MSAPTPRKPGSNSLHPSPSSSTEKSSAEFLGLMGAVLGGVLAGGVAIVAGEAIAGSSGSGEFDVCPLLYFMGGVILAIPLSILGISICKAITGRSRSGLFSVPCFFVPMAALITGGMIPSVSAWALPAILPRSRITLVPRSGVSPKRRRWS